MIKTTDFKLLTITHLLYFLVAIRLNIKVFLLSLKIVHVRTIGAFGILLLVLSSCIAMGKGSRKVKYDNYFLVGDGNDNDSSFFFVYFKNKSDYPLVNPDLSMTIKDTTNKMISKTLYSSYTTFADVPAHTDFYVKVYAEDFYFSDEVGKIKLLLSWTNKKGKNSFRRRIVYE